MLTPPPEDKTATPTSSTPHNGSSSFDVVSTYNNTLSTDPLITKPVAAIESLISLLSASPPSTISETLSLLESATSELKESVPNSIAISAGTDLFQRYLISTLQQGSAQYTKSKGKRSSSSGDGEFRSIRAHLLANSRLFVQRAKESRGQIATVARRFVRDGCTVLTCGRSRVVAAVLSAAAEDGAKFRVVNAQDSHDALSNSSTDIVTELRRKDVPVATIAFAALATSLPHITFALAGAESVVENGGIISGMGTNQMGLLAKSAGKPFYVVAESHKFVRIYPLSGDDLPLGQKVLDFRTEGGEERNEHEGKRKAEGEVVDFTPPDLITALVTESGVQTPSAVSEELIKIWS
ncbi:MAG: translation initiation factor eIF-2B subunit alpha [Alectoria fallacina]|uniref:Translation initiation factor eIF2B subunit alpha n=1 Tax=Alectoria fallacina TaxID=1903189 RepID=A0A8H3PIH2_9LECA|nr:MAG: translation initiation factor eIF-2B subunit alpha [Alectoria fallacina]